MIPALKELTHGGCKDKKDVTGQELSGWDSDSMCTRTIWETKRPFSRRANPCWEFRGERTLSALQASWRKALRNGWDFGPWRRRPFSVQVRKNKRFQGKSDRSGWGKQNVVVMDKAEQGPIT